MTPNQFFFQREVKHKLPFGTSWYIFTSDVVDLELPLGGQLVPTVEEVVKEEPQISFLRGGSGERTGTPDN